MQSVFKYLLLRFCIVLSLFYICPCSPFFESLTVWKMPSGQLIYGLGDVHTILKEEYAEVASLTNSQHRYFILDVLDAIEKSERREETVAIVEDAWDYCGGHRGVCAAIELYEVIKLYSDYKDTPLFNLIREINKRRIASLNVEHRHTKIWGLTRNVRTLVAQCSEQPVPPISAGDIVQEYDEAVQELQQYPEPMLQDYYRSALRPIDGFDLRDLEPMRRQQDDILDYVSKHVPEQSRADWEDKLLSFDCPLVDARIIHDIVNSLKKKIIVLAGAAHVYYMGKILESVLSCRRIMHIGNSDHHEYDQSRAVRISYLEQRDFEILHADDPVAVAGCSYS